MRYRVFLDTNILISGIYFEGNESKILDILEIDLITCEDCINELHHITRKKLKHLGERSLELALLELEKALSDIEVIPRTKYRTKLKAAGRLINHKKDIPVLAAALATEPDYLLTGDRHFFYEQSRKGLECQDFNRIPCRNKEGEITLKHPSRSCELHLLITGSMKYFTTVIPAEAGHLGILPV